MNLGLFPVLNIHPMEFILEHKQTSNSLPLTAVVELTPEQLASVFGAGGAAPSNASSNGAEKSAESSSAADLPTPGPKLYW